MAQWAVLSTGAITALLQIGGVRDWNPNLYTLTGKSTALKFSSAAVIEGTAGAAIDDLLTLIVAASRTATVYMASEQLPVAKLPLRPPYVTPTDALPYAMSGDLLQPVVGTSITIQGGQGIVAGMPIAVQGKAVRLRVLIPADASFVPDQTSSKQLVTRTRCSWLTGFHLRRRRVKASGR